MAALEGLGQFRNIGLLIIRIGFGVSMMIHGLPKIAGGPELWTKVGGSMKVLGIEFMPVFWGFMAAASETFGGMLLVLGLFSRPACLFLMITMIVAATHHLANGDGFATASHPLELAILFLGLMFVGPGKYSVDKK